MNYTKGKWVSQNKLASYTGADEPKTIVSVDEAGKLIVIAILGENLEKAANAALIEAAPKMLQVLLDLATAVRPHIMKLGIKKGFSELVALNEADKVLFELTGKVFGTIEPEHPAPTDFNQEKTKLYSIREHNGTDIISFTRESDGCYFELGRLAKITIGSTTIKTGRITKIFESDAMSTGLAIQIDGQDASDASLLEHMMPPY